LFGSIELIGGSTIFPGLQKRLTRELDLLQVKHNVDSPIVCRAVPERKYVAWLGGALMAEQDGLKPMGVAIEDWNEYGPSHIHKMFYGL